MSILLSIFIIVSAYVLHRNPRTRHTVNRISFRLMCLSMFAEIVYDAVYLGTYIGDSGSIGSADELTTKVRTALGFTGLTAVGAALRSVVFGVGVLPVRVYGSVSGLSAWVEYSR